MKQTLLKSMSVFGLLLCFASMSAEEIYGTLYVTMGSSSSTVENFAINVTNNEDYIDINIPAFKIGKMPATVAVDASDVELGTEQTYSDVVTFQLITTKHYDANISADYDENGALSFTLETVDACYLGVPFTANIEFVQY